MKLHRRHLLQLAAGAAALPAMSRIANAEAYPTRPVHWIVSFTAGGPNDIVARIIGQYLSERLGPQIIIQKKVGARGKIGMAGGVNPPPDGYNHRLLAPHQDLHDALSLKIPLD